MSKYFMENLKRGERQQRKLFPSNKAWKLKD